MREGWNGLALGKALDAETASINQSLPLGMSLTKVTDRSVNISAAVDEFMIKFFVALLVVMAVCFVSMGWRVGGGGRGGGAFNPGRGVCGNGGDRQNSTASLSAR